MIPRSQFMAAGSGVQTCGEAAWASGRKSGVEQNPLTSWLSGSREREARIPIPFRNMPHDLFPASSSPSSWLIQDEFIREPSHP